MRWRSGKVMDDEVTGQGRRQRRRSRRMKTKGHHMGYNNDGEKYAPTPPSVGGSVGVE